MYEIREVKETRLRFWLAAATAVLSLVATRRELKNLNRLGSAVIPDRYRR